jgi:transposase
VEDGARAAPVLVGGRYLADAPEADPAEADAAETIDWDISVDSTVVRAHQHDELRERAVREVRLTGRPVAHVARDLGIHPEALRSWVRQAEADAGERDDRLTTAECDELKELRKEKVTTTAAGVVLCCTAELPVDHRGYQLLGDRVTSVLWMPTGPTAEGREDRVSGHGRWGSRHRYVCPDGLCKKPGFAMLQANPFASFQGERTRP